MYEGGADANNTEPKASEEALGQALQNARKQAGLTQQDLCQKAGIAYSTLTKIERGAVKSPSVFTIQRIAQVLGISLDNLLAGVEGTSLPSSSPDKKQSQTGVRFVFFDINGCLVRFFHRAFTQLSKETAVSPDSIETTFWHFNDAVCRGQMSMDEFNTRLAEKLNMSNLDWKERYMTSVEPIKEMHELLVWASEHYRIGLLSNIMPGFVQTMRERQLLPDVNYSVIIDSSEVGALKPEEKIYQIAQERTGCQANEVLFVDDSRSNLIAAERLGWHVLWFDDYSPQDSAARIRQALKYE